jgi:hypothetical protein
MSEVNEGTKRQFDGLAALESQRWKEYDNKVRHEWRLSIAIWIALVASIGAIFSGKQLHAWLCVTPVALAAIVAVLIFALHVWFLFWIQISLQKIREKLCEIRNKMQALIDESLKEEKFTRNIFTQPSMYVQALLTFLLCVVFFWMVSAASA